MMFGINPNYSKNTHQGDPVFPKSVDHSNDFISLGYLSDFENASEPEHLDADLVISPLDLKQQDALMDEINLTLESNAKHIEEKLNQLDGQQNKHLILKFLKTDKIQDNILHNPEFEKKVNFLSEFIPLEIQNNFGIFQSSKKILKILSYADSYLQAYQKKQSHLCLIYKEKILSESEGLLEEANKHLKNFEDNLIKNDNYPHQNSLMISENDKAQLKLLLDLWQVNLSLQQGYLDAEKIKLGTSTASAIISAIQLPLNYLPAKFLPSQVLLEASKFILVGVSWAFNVFGVIVSAFDLYQKHKNVGVLHNWIMDQRTCKKNNILIFNGSDETKERTSINAIRKKRVNASDYLIKTTKDLLTDRQTKRKEKIEALKLSFDSVEHKILDLENQSFDLSMAKIGNELNEISKNQNKILSSSYQIIDEELERWFVEPDLKEKYEDLLNAFTRAKQANQFVSEIQNLDEEDWRAIKNTHKKFHDKLESFLTNSVIRKEIFESWRKTRTREDRLGFYIDHQQIIEKTIKNSLIEMVEKKNQLEKKFTWFKFKSLAISYSATTLSLAITGAITLAALSAFAVPGAGWILLGITLGTSLLSAGIIFAGYHLAFSKKYHSTLNSFSSLPLKSIFATIRLSIRTYRNKLKEKKLFATANILHELQQKGVQEHTKKHMQATEKYNRAKNELEYSQMRIKFWEEKLDELNARFNQYGWEDFSKYASLTDDSLNRIQNNFEQLDLLMIDDELKKILSVQVGIDLKMLQKNNFNLKNELQKCFAMSDAEYIAFIKRQNALIEKKFL